MNTVVVILSNISSLCYHYNIGYNYLSSRTEGKSINIEDA